jgi:8-oxo-dGTP pyrophosphatase MutT (NUDIX family)
MNQNSVMNREYDKFRPKSRFCKFTRFYDQIGKFSSNNANVNDDEFVDDVDSSDGVYRNESRRIFKNIYCANCGKLGHEYKHCSDPIISIGIILLKFDYAKIRELFSNLINGCNDKVDITNNGIKIESSHDISLFSKLRENIKFLLIRRKHTLGYIEFIRGRYKPDNVDGIVFLFQQMTKEEITKIGSMTITELWDDFWVDPQKKILYDKEFQKTKQKFEKLKNGDETELTLDFYVKHVVPTWEQAEWGFPKGRRNKLESNKECAIREFEEESGFTKDDYILLDGIRPLVEEFIGTNGVKYKHIYYVAYSNSDRVPLINKGNAHQATEVGDIGYYTYNEVVDMIRPYHVERKKIIMKLYMYLLEKIISELKYTLENDAGDSDEVNIVDKDNTVSKQDDDTVSQLQDNVEGKKCKKKKKKVKKKSISLVSSI